MFGYDWEMVIMLNRDDRMLDLIVFGTRNSSTAVVDDL